MAKRRDPVSSAGVDVIVTTRLPRLCPSCAGPHPQASDSGLGTVVIKLTCGRCAWSARYELVDPEEMS